ncbi:MAG: hypothetical protein ACI86X_000526 [Moritella sp.]|jgi:hypothetical protein
MQDYMLNRLVAHLSRQSLAINVAAPLISISALVGACPIVAAELDYNLQGHLKGIANYQQFSTDSLHDELGYRQVADLNSDTRINFKAYFGTWQVDTDYQLTSIYGDTQRLANQQPSNSLLPAALINDQQRLFDLTHTVTAQDNYALVHRLDRAVISYVKDALVVKLGRQAISWGNGLIYAPMDLFNPFSPSSIDKEYKTGDDMLYAQYLTDSGNDLQLVWVARRDERGNVDGEVDSVAVKYHLFSDNLEWDILLADHYQDHVFGLGNITNIGGAVWRSDLVYTRTGCYADANRNIGSDYDSNSVWSFVSNWSYSWMLADKNASALIEYHYNGFGQSNGDYSLSGLENNPALLARLARGELYTLGQHYLAGSVTVEISPLWLIIPNVFTNLSDHSGLIQLLSQHDLQQDLQLIVALNIPMGAKGSEFGGIPIVNPMTFNPSYLEPEYSVFAQLAWYF